ncbi:hypothetical protein C4580_01595 [Candidatus Woesearchaeota archaeon]|nr:MAG: hypothetical protein C4580_01595 [Candidatus Woesearchaeota archaeon]
MSLVGRLFVFTGWLCRLRGLQGAAFFPALFRHQLGICALRLLLLPMAVLGLLLGLLGVFFGGGGGFLFD